ncbi:MAG: hypothetical protein ACK5BV_03525 [Bacteroidota bacterium]|jgi:hypothetical protein
MSSHDPYTEVNFDRINSFTGDDPQLKKQLISAFLIEFENFRAHLKAMPTEEEFLNFRKVNHSISPSLQMLGLEALIKRIEEYKTSYMNDRENLNEKANQLKEMVQKVIDHTKEWISAH